MSSQSFQRNMVFSDFMIADHEALHALDDLEDLFDWASFEKPLKRLYPSQTGRPSHPLLMLFRMLLLQHLHGVSSDVQMEKLLARGERKDAEAGWCVKKNAKGKETQTYGYKIHTNCDEDGFILRQKVTAGNV